MKKILLIISLFFGSSLFAAETFVLNTTPYEVKAYLALASDFCDDIVLVLAPKGQRHYTHSCCLKSVQFFGQSGPVKGSKSSSLGGEPTGFGLSCGKKNQFRVKAVGNELINERY